MRLAGAVCLLALVGALSCVGVASSRASSCDKEVAAQIRFPADHACWAYRGSATLFVGKFSSGQTVSAQMTGEAADYNPRDGSVATVSRPRDPNVEGPGGYFFAVPDGPGVMTFVAPATGTYRFSFSPCAMWGAPGVVKIRAAEAAAHLAPLHRVNHPITQVLRIRLRHSLLASAQPTG